MVKQLIIILIIVLGIQSFTYSQAVLEQDIYLGGASSVPDYLTAYNGKLFFRANDGLNGNVLMSYDGAAAIMEADVNPSSGAVSGPRYLTEYGGKLYFNSHDELNGSELWSFDGTTATMVSDMNPAGYSSSVSYLTVFDGKLFFWNGGVTAGFELWSYDGQSFVLEGSIASGNQDESQMTEYNGKLYFKALGELYSFDSSNISLALNINPSGDSHPANMTVFDGKLFFSADDGTNGFELWSFDGVSGVLEADINPNGSSYPSGDKLAVFQDKLFFGAGDDTYGFELWSFDGTNATLEADIVQGTGHSQPHFLTLYAGKLFFFARTNPSSSSMDLWSYDGSSASLEADIVIPIDFGRVESIPRIYGGKLYFDAYDSAHGNELWSFTDPSVGIDETYSISPTVYPNPGSGFFNISSSLEVQDVKVFNSMGQIAMTESRFETKNVVIDLSGFADGIYTVEVFTDGGTTYKKLIKSGAH